MKLPDPHLAKLIYQQRGICVYCELPMEGTGRFRATVDHIKPRSRGGSEAIENKVAACSWCNNQKGSMANQKWGAFYPQIVRFRNQSPKHAKEQIRKLRQKMNFTAKDHGNKAPRRHRPMSDEAKKLIESLFNQ